MHPTRPPPLTGTPSNNAGRAPDGEELRNSPVQYRQWNGIVSLDENPVKGKPLRGGYILAD